jgi:hypothetical protein
MGKNKNRKNRNKQNHKIINHENQQLTHVDIHESIKQTYHPRVEDMSHIAEQIEGPASFRRSAITTVISFVVALILTTFILMFSGVLKMDEAVAFLKNKYNFNKIRAEDISSSQNILSASENENATISENGANIANALNDGPALFYQVKMPMLLGASYGIETEKIGCDYVWWVTKSTAPTTAPLNATYREMFAFDQELDFYTGNYVKTQSELTFDKAELENGLAKVYLNGKVNKTVGECDADRLKNQLTLTALQFDTVSSVEIYLNGALY